MSVADWWSTLPADRRQRTVRWGVAGAALLVPLIGFSLRDTPPAHRTPAPERQAVELEPDLMDADVVSTLRSELYDRDRQIAALNAGHSKEIAALRDAITALRVDTPPTLATERAMDGDEPAVDSASSDDMSPNGTTGYPAPPPPSEQTIRPWNPLVPSSPAMGREGGFGPTEAPEPPRIFGGIAAVHVASDSPQAEAPKRGVYLPPSFMEGTLLTGLHASTTEFGQQNPQNVLIRIATPAILPNRVKQDLKGCFVIAHGFGALDAERVHMRLATLSCVARSGARVIDQAVQGYVADSDGIAGLAGRVVSKMGASVARATLAGVIGGVGTAAEGASTVQSISALGQTTTTDPNKLLTAGIGGGIGTASDELTEFYLGLARQAAPVLEVGPTKHITVIITKGVLLNIADYEGYDRDL